MTPGADRSISRTSAALIFCSVSSVMASLCARKVGMRTAVHDSLRSGASMILRDSHVTYNNNDTHKWAGSSSRRR